MTDLSDEHYEALASIRHELRRFLHFSEQAASADGITARQWAQLLHRDYPRPFRREALGRGSRELSIGWSGGPARRTQRSKDWAG